MEEIAVTRERLAVLSNDVEALDRVLETLGYDGEVSLTVRAPRIVLFYRGELRQFLIGQLREKGPQTAKQLAQTIINYEGKDGRDRRMMLDVVRRISKALRQMRDAGLAISENDTKQCEFVWRLAV